MSPLKKGYSDKTRSKNIAELMRSKPSKTREKGIMTIAKKRGVSPKKAEAIQATAIAYKTQDRAKGKKGAMMRKMRKAITQAEQGVRKLYNRNKRI